MKRIFALLLTLTMLLSLTLPAYAQEAEIVEEIQEEVIEEASFQEEIAEEIIEELPEVITEEITEEPAEEVAEEAAEEVVEEVAEEAITFTTGPVTGSVANSEATAADEGPDLNMLCEACTQEQGKDVLAMDCRAESHGFGPYTLWMHIFSEGTDFQTQKTIYVGSSFTTKLVVGNWFSQNVIPDASAFQIMTIGENGPCHNEAALTIEMTEPEDGDIRPDFTVTANQPGTHKIRYEETYEGNTYCHEVTIKAVEPQAVDGKKLFIPNTGTDPSGNTLHTYLTLSMGDVFNTEFLFGTGVADAVSVRDLSVIGNSIALQFEAEDQGHYYHSITARKEGYSLIVYELDGLQYCLSVKVVSGNDNSNFMSRNYAEFTGNDGRIITTGLAIRGQETLDYASQSGGYYHPGSTTSASYGLGLLVREDGSYVEPERLTDVSFEVLACDVPDALSIGPVGIYSEAETGLRAKLVMVTSAPTTFNATIAASYTLDGTMRITHQFQLWCSATLSDVTIHADDLDTAEKLNVALSSWEAFTAWAQDQHGVTIIPGAAVHLYLPPVSYDKVIVAQAMSPMNYNNPQPLSLISLYGTNGTNGRTSMCGLIEKCSLVWIGNIRFTAQKKQTMTTTGENKAFTCGILTDYKNSFRPEYDEDYLERYCGGNQPSLELPADRIKSYGDIFNTGIDLGTVQDCVFSGFDYGMRATPYGHIGSLYNNTYIDNYYGIYIDNDGSHYEGGDNSADAGNASQTDYKRLTFNNNQYAVRMVTIPCDANDYRVRVHDSNFIDNFREFWIDEPGLFYFYRNYFAGKWHENENHHGDWEEYQDKLPVFDDLDELYGHYYVISEHRPGRVHYDKGDPSAAETLVIVNPCRNTPDWQTSTFWFYGGTDQRTMVERGDNSMPISGEAVTQLKEDAEIAVVENGNDVITYTFKGKKGGDQE